LPLRIASKAYKKPLEIAVANSKKAYKKLLEVCEKSLGAMR
jgi:hypothetical protein